MQSLLVIFFRKLGKQEPFSHWEQYGRYSVPKNAVRKSLAIQHDVQNLIKCRENCLTTTKITTNFLEKGFYALYLVSY